MYNSRAIKKLTGKPSEHKDFYDNCKYLLNKVERAEGDLYLNEEYEGVITNYILVNEITDIRIQKLRAEIFEAYLDITFNGNLVDN